jgi:hypothetical protein
MVVGHKFSEGSLGSDDPSIFTRGPTAGRCEFASDCSVVETCDFGTKNIMSSADVDCAEESLLSKPPNGSRRQCGLLNELTERHRRLRVALQRRINCCFATVCFHANRRSVNWAPYELTRCPERKIRPAIVLRGAEREKRPRPVASC